jgi:hypothetical protein
VPRGACARHYSPEPNILNDTRHCWQVAIGAIRALGGGLTPYPSEPPPGWEGSSLAH